MVWAGNVFPLPHPETQHLGDTRFFAEGGYYRTNANYDIGGGSYTSLDNGNYYQLFTGRAGAEYWFFSDFSFLADFGYGIAKSYEGFFDVTRQKNAPTDVTLASRYLVVRDPLTLIPEVSISIPFTRVDPDGDEALVSEGVVQIFGGLWAEKWFGNWKPFAEVGGLYQDGGRAAYLTYLLGAAFSPPHMSFGAELYGNVVVSNDVAVNQRIDRDAVTAQVNAGSLKFYSVNPTTLGLRGLADFNFNDFWKLGLTLDQTINGRASAAGFTVLLRTEVAWDFESLGSAKQPESTRFEPEEQKYDSQLFSEPKPPPEVAPRAPRRQRVFQRPKKKIDIDKSLEDVQKSLEN
jgi:hypothetical protein